MRIFLTGGTGYIGRRCSTRSCARGITWTRWCGTARRPPQVQERGAQPRARRPRRSRDLCRRRRGRGRRRSMRRSSTRPRRRRSTRTALDTLLDAWHAARPVRHLHVRHLGAGPCADAGGRERAAQSDRAIVAWRPAHEAAGARCGHRRAAHGRRPARRRLRRRPRHRRRPAQGCRQQPGPRDRQRRQPLAAGLRPGSRRSVPAAGAEPRGVGHLSRQRRGGRDGSTTSLRRSAST